MLKEDIYRCRVCGLMQGVAPWGEDGKTSSFDICGCCGVQFGYEDCKVEDIREYRKQWLSNRAVWFCPHEKPENWNCDDQLTFIPTKWK
jgi:hypothetical protein